ncbi:ROK family protein [Catenulispora pinisilvae]|uniref:ROK family protein n=1 Tax=Catenulispora pinisilvae TaxID=2705253 RepID=UPI0018923A2C|nr:ROK family protein [Catenulispora pinisilvae]
MADQSSRLLNVRAVMDQLQTSGPLSRAELARRCRLSKQTVSEVVAQLEAAGWLRATGESVIGGAGRSAALYEVDPASGLVVGVDLGGTKIRAALGDFGGAVLREQTVATDPRGGHVVIDQIAELARGLAQAEGLDVGRVACLALGSPGALDRRTGVMAFAPNIPSFGDLDVAAELGARLGGVTTVVENDVNVSALGEQWAGHGRGLQDFVVIAVGTGIGMGIVVGGELRTGATGAAGEIGYMPIGADPFDPANRAKGPLEMATGGEALARRYVALQGTAAAGPVAGDRHLVPAVFDGAARGDWPAIAALHDEARVLALAISAVAAVLDPELVVLGGGIGAREELLRPVRSVLAQLMARPVEVRASALGDRAGLLGAVAVALRTAQEQLFAAPAPIGITVPAPDLDRLSAGRLPV